MTEMTADEVKSIRWVEHVLVPVLLLSVGILSTCAAKTQDTVTKLQTQQAVTAELAMIAKDEATIAIKALTDNQATMLKQQHKIEVNVQRIDTRQEAIEEDVEDMKAQNTEMLKILRSLPSK